jgi:hypothetical protein
LSSLTLPKLCQTLPKPCPGFARTLTVIRQSFTPFDEI